MSKFSKLIAKQKELKQQKKFRFNLEATTNANRESLYCVCGSKKLLQQCCKPIHTNITKAIAPVDLMRSRYAAYVYGNIDYLLLSHHSSTRPVKERESILEWATSVTWLGLEIVAFDEPIDETGFVTFKARFLEDGNEQLIYEKSRFVKENGHWTYIDGVHF